MTPWLTPLRTLAATAPSGGAILFQKYSESDRELSYYCGILTAAEEAQMWKAKLKAERPGIARWDQARAVLMDAGWTIEP